MREPERFIVVDDNRTNNLICEFAIRKYKKDAVIALFTEPEVALQNIKLDYDIPEISKPTVLFLDINMPSMTGWEFLEEFRSFGEEVQRQFAIYILTSSVDERDKEKAEADPLVVGFFSKPLTATIVQEAVARNAN
jgi:two-component system chemotaxis response regulator CheY